MKVSAIDAQNFLYTSLNIEAKNVTTVSGGEWSQTFSYVEDKVSKIIRFSDTDEDFLNDSFAFQFSVPTLPIPKITKRGKAYV